MSGGGELDEAIMEIKGNNLRGLFIVLLTQYTYFFFKYYGYCQYWCTETPQVIISGRHSSFSRDNVNLCRFLRKQKVDFS